MKRFLSLSLLALMLAGCGHSPLPQASIGTTASESLSAQDVNLVKSQIKQLVKVYFRYLDDNGDGRVSKKELAKNAPGPFFMRPYFDKNNDGYLSYDELLQMMGTTVHTAAKLLYTVCDTNFDGQVTRDDIKLVPFAKYFFTLVDKNDDGVVSLTEFEKFVTSIGLVKNPF
jgi:Ca2+-binding EF-hand superfamily protein